MITDTQHNTGEGHEDLSREGDNSVRSDVSVDGYSGPRARMVFDAENTRSSGRLSPSSDDSRLGIFERIVVAGLALLTMFAVVVSLAVVPFAILGYYTYRCASVVVRFLLQKKDKSRFVILGTDGSYIIKDVVTREFVAKNIPSMSSASKILRIFESDKPTSEVQ